MTHDERRIDRLERVVVDAKLARGRQADVVMHNVGPARQRREGVLRAGFAQLERHAALAALRAGENPFQPTHRVACGRLDLDHIRAEVGQQHGGERPGQIRAEVEHLQARQRRLCRGRCDAC